MRYPSRSFRGAFRGSVKKLSVLLWSNVKGISPFDMEVRRSEAALSVGVVVVIHLDDDGVSDLK